ncbi:MAG: LacI family DNA-binding transcriptional regulator [bacterium]
MAVTITDVARLANVSVATVSRVLNASAPVREDTRARVLEVARELHFSPNGAARTLKRRQASALGVILPDLYGEFFSELLRGIDQEAQRAGHALLVSSSHHDAHGVSVAVRAMRGRVDGLLVMAPEVSSASLATALPDGLPTVILNTAATKHAAAAVMVDNMSGTRVVVQHLAALGHQTVAFICGPPRNADATARLRGYRAAMRDAGLPVHESLVFRGDFTEDGGWQAARAMIATAGPRPTALFAANDAMAVGALLAFHEAGFDIPRDISVVGFDDIPIARYVTPSLTTVRVAIDVLGARAAALLFRALTDPLARGTVHREVIPAELIVRHSCGPPPTTAPQTR